MASILQNSTLFNLSLGAANEASSSCLDSSPFALDLALDRLQDALSVEIPKLPYLKVFGRSFDMDVISGKYRIALPDLYVLHTLNIGLLSSIFVGFLFSIIIFRCILNNKNNHFTIAVSLLGATLVVSSALIPYLLINILGTQNTAVRFIICLPFVLFFFRTLEAIFGFVPKGAKSSMKVYCVYFSMPVEMIFDDKSRPAIATRNDIMKSLKNTAYSVLSIISLISILSPHEYTLFGETNAGEFYEEILWKDYLDLRHLGNCFAIALLFQQALGLGDAVFGNIVQIFFGYKVVQGMKNPMLEATSPSDFWGRRWNVLVHSVMKRGVYKPVRKFSSALLASLAVFVASGLFHEWLVHAVLLYKRPDASDIIASGDILLGSNTAFFVWNFVVIVGERILAGSTITRSIGARLPRFMVTFIIIMTSLPFAHWFGNPYVNGRFFDDYERCIPLIQKI